METDKKVIKPPVDLSGTIHILGDLLGQVIIEQESIDVFNMEESFRQASKARRKGELSGYIMADLVSSLTPQTARAIASAFTIYFDLVNLAEENDRVRMMLQEEQKFYPSPVPESIGEAVALIKQNGVAEEKMASLIERLSVELVLTAHPTEAKRRTILSKLKHIAEILENFRHTDLRSQDIEEYLTALHAEIAALWLTDRARTTRPAVTDEVRNRSVFYR